jgi:FkbM family methyltransferase
MSIITALGRRFLDPFLGKRRFQGLFEKLHLLSLAGMNFGQGTHPERSGEEEVMRRVRAAIAPTRSRPVLFDVGANIGEYSLDLLKIFGKDAGIYAFEPARATFERLRSNLAAQPSVRAFQMGLGAAEETLELFSPGDGSKLASLHRRPAGGGIVEQVRVTTLDRFCAENGIEHIDLLKLDVEGHELSVLQGATGMIDRGGIDFIQFEFGVCDIASRTYFKDFYLLLNERYRIYRVLQDGFHAISEYHEVYEVFKRATNYLAERRGR